MFTGLPLLRYSVRRVSSFEGLTLDYLWTPWRYQYMAQATGGKQPDCIFCDAAARKDDENTLVVHRGKSVFIILNRFPYTSGHAMIVPYAHVADLNLSLNDKSQSYWTSLRRSFLDHFDACVRDASGIE